MSDMLLLDNCPDNPLHAVAYQLKEQLGLAMTPALQRLENAATLAYLGCPGDVTLAAAAGSVKVFGIEVRLNPYGDGSYVAPVAQPVVKAPVVKAPARKSGG